VSGEDRSAGPTTELLEKKGISVRIGDGRAPDGTDLVIYSDAVPEAQPARADARARGIRELSYFQALGEVGKNTRTIAVGGTHGKTTTTAMLVKILKDTGKNPTAVIGSLVKDFGSNFVDGDPNLFVVEACEYKDHILELKPDILVITNVEWDHTDWFKTEAAMRATFDKARASAKTVIDTSIYSSEPEYELTLIGDFNKDNARAASAAAKAAFPDITNDQIAASLKTFHGTWRRFEYKGKTKNGALVYDDYAHHPTAIAATIAAVREKFPDKKIAVAFHPHLYSRTRDLFDGFVTALAKADYIFVAPIFAARETDDGTVSSEMLAAAIRNTNPNAEAVTFETIEKNFADLGPDTLVLTMGAGDIYKVAEKLVRVDHAQGS
jgi:UDP-N-acetylmuramate--alanine ligase